MFKDDERSRTHFCGACEYENIQCPACGFYCNGKGGLGCIDKINLVKSHIHSCGRQDVIGHISGAAGVSRKNREALPSWEGLREKLAEKLAELEHIQSDTDDRMLEISKEIKDFIHQIIKTEREQAVKDIMKTKISKKEVYIRGLTGEALEYIKR